ncbi:MAG TPA: bifunctional acetate--CoA ligase family protein/GNAT family N-acetyltransferase [Rhizomicrobium sp.]|nr:bifunctional acetate--CoA ligase family protein/GNAT family N-acetyltransferase [Rhizomicrobium sp.]
MSIRNLGAIFRPQSVALIGASTHEHSVGNVVARNLMSGGFAGPVMPVNPRHGAVAGVLAYPNVAALPVTPDLAVICTPPETVPSLISQLGARGTKGAVVITAGFGEGVDGRNRGLRQAMLDAAKPNLLRIVGPNCLGVVSTEIGLNASFAQINAKSGSIAFVAQSGAVLTTVLDWASARGIGFSHLVSLGDMSDVDFGDLLDYLALDPNTHAIVLYVEAVTHARKFMSAARAAARIKPVIAIKAGRHAAAARAALSHTGALAGSDAVYGAAFRRAGILRVMTLEEIFDALETIATLRANVGDRLAILTNGGGIGVLATDSLLDRDGKLAELSAETIARLDAVLPKTWSRGNPVDIIGDAPPKRYADALSVLLESPEVDCVLVLNCPTAVASGTDAARAVIETAAKHKRPLLTNWLGKETAEAARKLFNDAGLPAYETPDQAVRGFMHLVRYRRAQDTLREVPPSLPAEFAPDMSGARRLLKEALGEGKSWLDPMRLNALFRCYEIPAPRLGFARDVSGAAALAESFGLPVALKIQSADILHKSDVGGVVLGLRTPESVRDAAQAMTRRLGEALPKARLEGFIVQEMIVRPNAQELILGMSVDPTFGPVLLFGQGGTAVEVIGDKSLALPPLNLALARSTMERTRVFRQLQGYRDRPAADLDALALTFVKLSQLVCDHDEIQEIDINPLLADENGVVALDARVRLSAIADERMRGDRLSIRAYPKELEQDLSVPEVGDCLLRPIRPEDAGAIVRLFQKLTPEDIRLRFFSPWREMPPTQLARLTQIDYDREMAFVLLSPATGEILGVVRLAADPDNVRAEFAVLVRSDLKGHGIGRILMKRLIEHARARGLKELFGEVLAENTLMLALCRELGFTTGTPAGSAGILRASLQL